MTRQMRMSYLIAACLTLTSSTSARIAIKFHIDSTHTHTVTHSHTRIISRLLLCLLNCCAFNARNCSQTSHKIHTENICSFPARVCASVCVSFAKTDKLPILSTDTDTHIHKHIHTRTYLSMCVCVCVFHSQRSSNPFPALSVISSCM